MARLLQGKPLAAGIQEDLKARIAASGRKLTLASVQVGSDPASEVYLKSQRRTAESLGIEYRPHTLDRAAGQERIADFIRSLNADPSVNGIILQLPLPQGTDYRALSALIDPAKDVEAVHPVNLGQLVCCTPRILPCTPAAVMELLDSTGIDYEGKEAVIIGHSAIVGKPLGLLLLRKLATVTVCHIGTARAGKLEEHVRRAQILVVAVGKPGLIRGELIAEGAVVVDVGINRVGDRITGDIEFEAAEKRASWITPVPGGVGLLTVTMLMRNLVYASGL